MAAASSSSSAQPTFRILETSTITPPACAALPTTSLSLTFLDALWLKSPPVERVFFFPPAAEATIPPLLSSLKSSLSQTLASFFPLAGRLRVAPGMTNRHELFYTNGDGVAFTVAEYDANYDGLDGHRPRHLSKLLPLVPRLPEPDAVLALQVTVLQPCRGLAIGVTVHHAACDGSGSTHFIHTWAANCRQLSGVDLPPPPVVDRTLVTDPRGLYGIITGELLSPDEFELAKSASDDSELLLGNFTLTEEHLRRIKEVVSAEAKQRKLLSMRCSTVVAVYGFVWSTYVRAKAGAAAFQPDERRIFIFPVDHRARLQPPIPDKYLGNCLGPGIASAAVAELARPGKDGLFTACAAIATAIDEAVHAGLRGAEGWVKRFKETLTLEPLSVAGSARFRVYDIDFGCGKPVKVDIVSVAKTGAIAVSESSEKGGGAEVGLALQAAGMEKFKNCFTQGMEMLFQQA